MKNTKIAAITKELAKQRKIVLSLLLVFLGWCVGIHLYAPDHLRAVLLLFAVPILLSAIYTYRCKLAPLADTRAKLSQEIGVGVFSKH